MRRFLRRRSPTIGCRANKNLEALSNIKFRRKKTCNKFSFLKKNSKFVDHVAEYTVSRIVLTGPIHIWLALRIRWFAHQLFWSDNTILTNNIKTYNVLGVRNGVESVVYLYIIIVETNLHQERICIKLDEWERVYIFRSLYMCFIKNKKND